MKEKWMPHRLNIIHKLLTAKLAASGLQIKTTKISVGVGISGISKLGPIFLARYLR